MWRLPSARRGRNRKRSSSLPEIDDRIWRPDLLAVLDYEVLWEASQKAYSENPLATWWVSATPGVNYYRAELPARHVPGKTVFLEDRDIQPLEDGHWFPRQEGSTAIWMFPGNVARWLLMAEMRLNHDLHVLVEVDDNYLTGPPIPSMSEWASTRERANLSTGVSYECHRAIVSSEACQGIIVSTPRLGEAYERFGKPIHVCPNSIDPADWDMDPANQPDNVLRIGWAGSASHAYDLADIRGALDWAARQRDVEVVVLGQLQPGVEHRQIPWTDDLAQYRRNVCELDVILCPIRPSPWADCKSDVKALEGAMAGAVPVVSRTEPFRPWFERTYVAETPKEYLKIVKHLVANREETRQAAEKAREYVLRERTIQDSVHEWRRALEP